MMNYYRMIKNIIFDLGGVIYDINYHNIATTFASFGMSDFEEKYSQEKQTDLIDLFEEGKVSVEDFRRYIRSLTSIPLSDDQIDIAWNAILIDIPEHRVNLLQQVKKNYSIFLFSNTNELNYSRFIPDMKEKYGFDIFSSIFIKSYFSHHIHLKKPSKESFFYIMEEQKLNPSETLFIDDTTRHVEGARAAGLSAYLLPKNQDIETLFERGRLKEEIFQHI